MGRFFPNYFWFERPFPKRKFLFPERKFYILKKKSNLRRRRWAFGGTKKAGDVAYEPPERGRRGRVRWPCYIRFNFLSASRHATERKGHIFLLCRHHWAGLKV